MFPNGAVMRLLTLQKNRRHLVSAKFRGNRTNVRSIILRPVSCLIVWIQLLTHFCLGGPSGSSGPPLLAWKIRPKASVKQRLKSHVWIYFFKRRGPKPKNSQNMVRFGSGELWTSAPGVKRVQRTDPPWSRGRPRPKKDQNCQHSKH